MPQLPSPFDLHQVLVNDSVKFSELKKLFHHIYNGRAHGDGLKHLNADVELRQLLDLLPKLQTGELTLDALKQEATLLGPEYKELQTVTSLSEATLFLQKKAGPFWDVEKILIKKRVMIMVVGRVSSGKSFFLNWLLGENIFKVADAPCTSFVSLISSGNTKQVCTHYANGTCGTESLEGLTELPEEHCQQPREGSKQNRIMMKHIHWTDNPLLESGLEFVDTPGFDEPGVLDMLISHQILARVDAVLFLFDLQSGFLKEQDTLSEMYKAFQVQQQKIPFFFIGNKLDQLYKAKKVKLSAAVIKSHKPTFKGFEDDDSEEGPNHSYYKGNTMEMIIKSPSQLSERDIDPIEAARRGIERVIGPLDNEAFHQTSIKKISSKSAYDKVLKKLAEAKRTENPEKIVRYERLISSLQEFTTHFSSFIHKVLYRPLMIMTRHFRLICASFLALEQNLYFFSDDIQKAEKQMTDLVDELRSARELLQPRLESEAKFFMREEFKSQMWEMINLVPIDTFREVQGTKKSETYNQLIQEKIKKYLEESFGSLNQKRFAQLIADFEAEARQILCSSYLFSDNPWFKLALQDIIPNNSHVFAGSSPWTGIKNLLYGAVVGFAVSNLMNAVIAIETLSPPQMKILHVLFMSVGSFGWSWWRSGEKLPVFKQTSEITEDDIKKHIDELLDRVQVSNQIDFVNMQFNCIIEKVDSLAKKNFARLKKCHEYRKQNVGEGAIERHQKNLSLLGQSSLRTWMLEQYIQDVEPPQQPDNISHPRAIEFYQSVLNNITINVLDVPNSCVDLELVYPAIAKFRDFEDDPYVTNLKAVFLQRNFFQLCVDPCGDTLSQFLEKDMAENEEHLTKLALSMVRGVASINNLGLFFGEYTQTMIPLVLGNSVKFYPFALSTHHTFKDFFTLKDLLFKLASKCPSFHKALKHIIDEVESPTQQDTWKSLERNLEAHFRRVRKPRKDLWVLSLDGGGMRGIVELTVLRMIEKRTGKKIGELFDMIGGTSTGGIIALGLARGCSTEEGFALFERARKEVFQTSLISSFWAAVSNKYSSAALRTVLFDIFKEETLSDLSNLPKVFVTSVSSGTPGDGVLLPYLFRNYDIKESYFSALTTGLVVDGTSRAKIWEAALASSAAPTYFAPLMLLSENTTVKKVFKDGGLCFNNPAPLVKEEVSRLWPDSKIKTFVSIGTGMRTIHDGIEHKYLLMDMAFSLINLVTHSEKFHNVMINEFRDTPTEYYRINPDLGEAEFPLDFNQIVILNKIKRSTERYLLTHAEQFGPLFQALADI